MTTFPVVSPEVVSELGLNYAQTGVITAAYMLGYGLFQLPASFLGIRMGSGRVLLGAMILMSVGALLPCLFARPAIWVVSRFVLGVAGAAVLPLSVHLLTQAMTGARLVKGLAMAISGWGTRHDTGDAGRGAAAAPGRLARGDAGGRRPRTGRGCRPELGAASRSRVGDRAAKSPHPARLLRQFGANRALNWMGIINAAGTSMTICVSGWLPLVCRARFRRAGG